MSRPRPGWSLTTSTVAARTPEPGNSQHGRGFHVERVHTQPGAVVNERVVLRVDGVERVDQTVVEIEVGSVQRGKQSKVCHSRIPGRCIASTGAVARGPRLERAGHHRSGGRRWRRSTRAR